MVRSKGWTLKTRWAIGAAAAGLCAVAVPITPRDARAIVSEIRAARGSAGLDGNFGGLADPSGHRKWRIVESFTFQSGPVGGQTIAMWQRDSTPAGQETHLSLGGRVSYALTKHFELVSELGHSQVKPEGGATAKLTKFTFASTLSTGPGFWNRPELRLYVTTAKWNAAANALAVTSATDNIVGVPAFSGKTSGTSYGAQVEVWF